MNPADVVDAALETTIVPSFTKIGYAVRGRLDRWRPLDSYDMTGRTVVVTGATSGLGRHAAERMALLGARVVVTGRETTRTARVGAEIQALSGDIDVLAIAADMGEPDQVTSLADEIRGSTGRIDVLIHNAGALSDTRRTNSKGVEATVASQVIGPFLLTTLLLGELGRASPGRVITVSSGGMYTADVTVEHLQMGVEEYRGSEQYARAKRAQVTLNELWASHVPSTHAVFQAMHPGWADTPGVQSALPRFRSIVGPLLRSPEQGADTIVWLACDEQGGQSSGGFWLDRRPRRIHRLRRTHRSDTANQRARLWSWCVERSGVDPGRTRMTPAVMSGGDRIAIVGSGIAGLTCAHVLGPHHDVVLFEADGRLGGHANTVDVDDPLAGRLAVDTGFIVHNDRTYPHLVALFEQLGVETFDTTMSFAVTDRDQSSPTLGLTYRATSPNSLFADRRNLGRPAVWRMLRDIVRFYRAANEFLRCPDDSTTLGEMLAEGRYASEFIDLHLIPLGSAVWSADPTTFVDFPARSLLTFLSNHGLLGVGNRPQWRAVRGGSRTYVDALAARFAGSVRLSSAVERVRRSENAVIVETTTSSERFDRVILAVHADQALSMLVDPAPAERDVLGAIRFQTNQATLHTDTNLLSPRTRAWAAWNYDRRGAAIDAPTVTYDLTTLQRLRGHDRYLLSLNSDEWIDPRSVIESFTYAHPIFDRRAVAAQRRFGEIDGAGGVHYCGAWWGHGFHEDGMVSAMRVCDAIGVRATGREIAFR